MMCSEWVRKSEKTIFIQSTVKRVKKPRRPWNRIKFNVIQWLKSDFLPLIKSLFSINVFFLMFLCYFLLTQHNPPKHFPFLRKKKNKRHFFNEKSIKAKSKNNNINTQSIHTHKTQNILRRKYKGLKKKRKLKN